MDVLRHFAIATHHDRLGTHGLKLLTWGFAMKFVSQIVIAALATFTLEECSLASATEGNPIVPTALSVPAGYLVKMKFNASGVQIYRCLPSAQDTAEFTWTFNAPEAKLFDENGKMVGNHYAGPTWEVSDGRKVVGKLAAKAAAPDGKSIPWLLLAAEEVPGDKFLEKTAYVQRLNTKGGSAPTSGCSKETANSEVRVPYTADYYFYAKY